jgi:very-short-patch-repair endonuclease
LKSIGLNVKIEHFDTRKTVDIAIHKEGQPILLIEVDGEQHSSDYEQVRKDIWRSYGSFIESSLFTLHIPNVQLEEDVIYQICSEILGVFKNLLIRDLKQLIETRKQAETEYKKLVGFIQPFTRINVPS